MEEDFVRRLPGSPDDFQEVQTTSRRLPRSPDDFQTTSMKIFMAEKRFEYRYATEDELEEMKQREFTGWMFTYPFERKRENV
ncbi:hypothetical protein Bca101_072443 [Brassica carinata]